MAVELGIAPIGWSNDDLPELGGEITLEQCLREARLAGYTGVEKGGKFPENPDELKPILDEFDLKLASGWYSGGLLVNDLDTEKQLIKTQLNLYQRLGVPLMVYGEITDTVQNKIDIPLSQRRKLNADDIKRYGEKVTRFAEWLEEEECPISFHHHMGTVIETQDEVDLLMENTDVCVHLLFDTGHLVFAGGQIEETLLRWGSRVNHVHVKDIRSDVLTRLKTENWSFLQGVLQGVFTVPGDGSIDFRHVARLLKKIDYKGWIVVEAEQDPAKANPLKMAETGMEEMRHACREANIEIV